MRETLTRERILRAAVLLIDADGLEALSMRKLGAALGVQAMSLYRYVPSKDALLDGVQEAILAEMPVVSADRGWQAAVAEMACAFREVLARHPRAIPVFVRPAATVVVLERIELPLQVLMDAGFDDLDALRAFQVMLAFVVGHAMWQFTPQGARAVDDEFEFGLQTLISGLEARLSG